LASDTGSAGDYAQQDNALTLRPSEEVGRFRKPSVTSSPTLLFITIFKDDASNRGANLSSEILYIFHCQHIAVNLVFTTRLKAGRIF
jgi:hypothetical protein